MVATYNNISSGSEASFLSGSLSTIGAIDDLADNYIDGLVSILDELVDEASFELRANAIGDPDWVALAPFLEVDLLDGEIQYGYVNDYTVAVQATALEYGVPPYQPPNPLIRSFAQSNATKFASEVTKRIEQELDFG